MTEQIAPATEVISAQEAVMLGAQSLRQFGRIFFPKTFRQESPEFHDRIGTELYSTHRYNAFEVFRDGAKTSLLRTFTAQRISYGISRTIVFVSVSQPHSVFSLRWLKRQVQYNTKWAQTFGLRKGEKWTDEVVEIYHGIEETPITILALGITGQIRGFNIDDYRPDLIILDDVLNEENTKTPEQRAKIESLIFGALLNSLAPETECPNAKAVFLQTPLHKEDAIEKCMQDPQWNGIRISVLTDEGESAWPARWSTETLLREKEAAVRRGQYKLWMREKECKVVQSEHSSFDVSRLQYYEALPNNMQIIIAVDPASSDSARADDNVVMAVGFIGNEVYVLDYHADKGVMPDAAAAHFFELVLMYGCHRAAVEKVAYQRVLKWYIEQEMIKRRLFVVIDGIDDRRNKADRILQAIAGLLSYGHIHIRPSMTKLIQQLEDFDPDVEQHDDVIDALAMAITAVNPALRNSAIEGEFAQVEDEHLEELLEMGAFALCP